MKRCGLSAALLVALVAGGQESHRRPLPDVPPEAVPMPQQRIDPTQLRREAEELSRLAQSIPADVEQVSRGILPKDVFAKLKHIEKLAKHLQGQISR